MSYKKGYLFERDLKLKLEKDGWSVIRSGGSKKPDIVAGKDGKIMIIECKVSKSNSVYISKEEVGNLEKVADNFGAECIFAIKIINKGWNLIPVSEMRVAGKNYVVDIS